MSNRILLIGSNFYPELTGIGKYNGEMMEWFSLQGFESTVVTTFPYYPQWKIQEQYNKKSFWFKKEIRRPSGIKNAIPINIIRCPHYVPQNPSGIKRLTSEFSFFVSSYFVIIRLLFAPKFDYIITVAPSFSSGLLGILYKKIRGGKFLYHIQDLQIDAAKDLNVIKSSIMINALFAVEKYILRKADHISTISEGMMKKVQKKCYREILFFPNWVDTKLFHPLNSKEQLKEAFGFNSDDKIVLYSGAIGVKQGLEDMLHTAKLLAHVPKLKFVICGSGPYKGHLEQLQIKLGLKNVVFMALQSYDKLNAFLNIADVHLVLQKKNASDLVMPSKLTTILAVGGVAIVTATEGTSLYNLMNSTELGVLIEPENLEALKNAILLSISEENDVKTKNARIYAEENLSINNILFNYSQSALLSDRNGKTVKETVVVITKEQQDLSTFSISVNN